MIAIGRGEFLGRAVHILARPLVDKIRRQKLEQRWWRFMPVLNEPRTEISTLSIQKQRINACLLISGLRVCFHALASAVGSDPDMGCVHVYVDGWITYSYDDRIEQGHSIVCILLFICL